MKHGCSSLLQIAEFQFMYQQNIFMEKFNIKSCSTRSFIFKKYVILKTSNTKGPQIHPAKEFKLFCPRSPEICKCGEYLVVVLLK